MQSHNKEVKIPFISCFLSELDESDRQLVELARQSCETSYAPYSHFSVGAAIRLEDGTTIQGSNQENAAFPSGTCAERCAMFYANSMHPRIAPMTIAIAAKNEQGEFTEEPISPCGACRQVLIESEHRYGKPLRIILSGKSKCYIIDKATHLLPFAFNAESM